MSDVVDYEGVSTLAGNLMASHPESLFMMLVCVNVRKNPKRDALELRIPAVSRTRNGLTIEYMSALQKLAVNAKHAYTDIVESLMRNWLPLEGSVVDQYTVRDIDLSNIPKIDNHESYTLSMANRVVDYIRLAALLNVHYSIKTNSMGVTVSVVLQQQKPGESNQVFDLYANFAGEMKMMFAHCALTFRDDCLGMRGVN